MGVSLTYSTPRRIGRENVQNGAKGIPHSTTDLSINIQ